MKKLLIVIAFLALAVPAAAQKSVVKKVRDTYPPGPLSSIQKVMVLSDVARALGPDWGVLANKPGGSGNVCRVPGDPVLYRCDHVCTLDRSRHVDVLHDEEGAADPSWDDNGPVPASRVCVAVPGNAPLPPPDPTPDPPPVDLERLLAAVGRLESELTVRLDDLYAQISGLRQQFNEEAEAAAVRDATLAEAVAGIRQSLEEHRAKGNAVLKWAKDWKNWLAVIGGIIAGWWAK